MTVYVVTMAVVVRMVTRVEEMVVLEKSDRVEDNKASVMRVDDRDKGGGI